jgi:hypothetical protein
VVRIKFYGLTEEKNEKLKLNKINFSCGFNKILDIELKVIKYKVELSKTNENDNKTHILWLTAN